jgi:hypothetical protein
LDVTALPTDEQTDEPTLEELDLEAYYQVMSDYELDLEIKHLFERV